MRFVMVHGGFHGAWCWERTIAELERLGHEGVAIDLPGHGERRHETEPTTFTGRRDAILPVLQAGDVLVGHSGGGFDITIAADAAPDLVQHCIYLAAALPREGRTYPDAMVMLLDGTVNSDHDVAGMLRHLQFGDDGAMTFATPEGARELFFHDCDDATVQWAFERLCAERGGETSSVPVSTAAFWEADLPRSYIRCLQDRAKPQWLSEVVVTRLGVEELTIDASHSPFLSRPAELAELLLHATTTTPIGPLLPRRHGLNLAELGRSPGMPDEIEAQLFQTLEERLTALAAEPPGSVVVAARREVQQRLLTVGADGSWPEPELLRETLVAVVDLVEELVERWQLDLSPDDLGWLDACREMVSSSELFADAVTDLRSDVPRPGP